VFAVIIFFVISGYFVAMSWSREPRALRYWKKRALRIFPALFVVVAVTVLVIGPLDTSLSFGDYMSDSQTWSYWKNALLAFGIQLHLPGVFASHISAVVNGSLWTLPAEMMMYGTIFIAGVGLRGFGRSAYPALAAIFGVLWWVDPGSADDTSRLAFELGVYFFVASTIYSFDLVSRLPRNWVVACAVIVALASIHGENLTRPLLWVAFPVIVLRFGALASPAGRGVASMGDISYGVYLWAFPIQQIVIGHTLASTGFWGSMLLAALGTAVLGLASWHLVERPALRLRGRSTLSQKDSTVSAAHRSKEGRARTRVDGPD